MSEIPVHRRPRRLVDWINPTGAKKVHSLVDKVYQAEEPGDRLGASTRPTGAVEAWMGKNLEDIRCAARISNWIDCKAELTRENL